MEKKDIIRQIYETLPKLNCGYCGFKSCGQFAKAVAERKASPFACRQNPWVGYRISQIMGIKVPAFGYEFQPAFVPGLQVASSKTLREEIRGLSQTVDDILDRVGKLKARR